LAARIFNIGSINLDRVFEVDQLVSAGQTIHAQRHRTFAGGKGANQSVALARAGVDVLHVGCIGSDDLWLVQHLAGAGVDVSNLLRTDLPTGQAFIQVDSEGQNAIVVHGGANLAIEKPQVEQALLLANRSDVLLLQNEVCQGRQWLEMGLRRGLDVWLNPAPMSPEICDWPLEKLSGLVVNEQEACALANTQSHDQAFEILTRRCRKTMVALTLGEAGAWLGWRGKRWAVSPPAIDVKDTTAAGDTFIGYLLAQVLRGSKPEQALTFACHAAALCVAQQGAGKSIPTLDQVTEHWPALA
jgi:ribokinase